MKQKCIWLFICFFAVVSFGCSDSESESEPQKELLNSTIVFADGSAVTKTLGSGNYSNAVSGDGDGTVTYTSDSTATATVNENTGEVTLNAAGDAVITASKSATSTHNSASNSYTLTVKAAVAVGDAYEGGIVAYILTSGDPGYDASLQHGIIAAEANLSVTAPWALADYQSVDLPGAYATGIGSGQSNTAAIVEQNGAGTGYAAGLCDDYTNSDTGTGVYSDWYLPSKDELEKLIPVRNAIGLFDYEFGDGEGFPPTSIYTYWSSSTNNNTSAISLYSGDNTLFPFDKFAVLHVHPVRSF